MKVISFQNPKTGGVSIRVPVDTKKPMAFHTADLVIEGIPHAIVDMDSLPDTYFHNAFIFHPTLGATVDMARAKEIQRDAWRAIRAKKFPYLDIASQRAIESGDSAALAEVVAQKQALRDVTKEPLPDDLASIKATFPEVLK